MSARTELRAAPPDTWLVRVGLYHFGPFTHAEADAMAQFHRGDAFPLWAADEIDAIERRPVIDMAYASRGRRS